jgi:eukaryotic-like serine/threonine-protein kinase
MTRTDDASAPRVDELAEHGVRVGTVVAGKFRLDEIVGSGGMGVVFKAWHLELEEHVALKFLLPSRAADRELRQRFALEAKAAAKLRGEHVVRVHDVGTLPGDVPYIVMEYLEGRTVGAMLRERGPLPVELACELTIQACEALAEAHARGIVHRDVKPENLVVTLGHDETPLLRMVDFGISKVALALDPGRTNPGGTVLGTPYYMSPEQLDGVVDVDGRTDIWSLGAVLFEMLAGRKPFSGQSFASLASEILTQPPRQLRKLRFDAPEELEAIVSRCLAKRPGDRFATVAELAAALEPFAPVEARAVAERAVRIVASGAAMRSERPSGSSLDEAILSSAKLRARPAHESPWRYLIDSDDVPLPRSVTPIPPPISGLRSVAPPLPVPASDLEDTQVGERVSGEVESSYQRRQVLLAATLAGLVLALALAYLSR